MTKQQLIAHLNTSRILIALLVFSQIGLFSWFTFLYNQTENEKLNTQIRNEEMIPYNLVSLELIPEGELR